jgi:hypothetical protein
MRKAIPQSTIFLLVILLIFNGNVFGQDNYAFGFTGARVCFNVDDNSSLDQTGDFTIEAWVYPTSTSTFYIAERPSIFRLFIINSGGAKVRFDRGSGTSLSSTVLALDQWHHIAVTRSGSATTIYTNGTAGANADLALSAGTVGCNVGAASSWSSGAVTHMFDELRFSNTARYTTDFIPVPDLGSDANTVFYFNFNTNTEVPTLDDGPLGLSTTNGPTSGSAGLMSTANYIPDSALPVELTSFTASSNKNAVELSWNTATEINNYGFEIERSADDQSFEKIGFVEGNINSSTAKSYSFSDKINSAGNYFYRLKQIDLNGTFEYSNTIEVSTITPEDYSISQNYPNPFNPSTTIEFKLPQQSNVNIKVYNTIGEVVAVLLNDNVEAGNHTVSFDASNLPSGIYIYRIETENFSQSMKMTLLK